MVLLLNKNLSNGEQLLALNSEILRILHLFLEMLPGGGGG